MPKDLAPTILKLLAPDEAGGAPCSQHATPRGSLWTMLEQMAELPAAAGGQPKLDAAAILACWRAAASTDEAAAALRVLLSLAQRSRLTAELATPLQRELLGRLRAFEASPDSAPLLVRLSAALEPLEPRASEHGKSLMRECEAVICGGGASKAKLQLALSVVGELALTQAGCSPSAALVRAVQALVQSGETPGDSDALSALSATAFVTLGKASVASLELAKRLVPVFLHELTSSPVAAVRNNALVVLFDLAKRHTALLERHFGTIALALYDPTPLVRQQALLLLSQLMLEDYVKWRPALFRAFCAALVDTEESICDVAHAVLFRLLLPRSPLLCFNSFLGLLFQLNGCLDHPQHSAALPEAEASHFEMRGETKQRKRLTVFRALLSHMTDEQRLQVTAKLCHEVLAALPDGQLQLSSEGAHAVLADALRLLACKEIKISAGGGGSASEEAAEDEAAAASASARGKILTAVARKATVESIVPIVIELKRFLEREHSPLLRDLFFFVRELLRDHKTHLQDILSRDRQLAAEIEYDMRQLANQPQSARHSGHRTRGGHTPLQALSPSARPNAPHSAVGSALGTPQRRRSSKGEAAALLHVPTPDCMRSSLSVPKLRNSTGPRRSSATHSASKQAAIPNGAAAAAAATTSAAALAVAAAAAAPCAQPTADIVMASPFKEAAPPRQWAICPSPMALGSDETQADALNAAARKDLFDAIAA